MSKKTAESSDLARFVAVLALSRRELQDYLAEPGPVMEDNGLTAEEQELLTEGSFQAVVDYLWEVGEKPIPDDEPSGGG